MAATLEHSKRERVDLALEIVLEPRGPEAGLRDEITSLIEAIEVHDTLEAEHRAFALRWIGSGAPLPVFGPRGVAGSAPEATQ